MKKFYILDGSGFLFRAYYAYPTMTTSDGMNINVAYGFIRMLLKIIADKPDYLVIVRDSPTKTIRDDIDPNYKANRPEPDQDLKRQIPYTQELIAQLHIPTLQIPGFEADDIIASLVKAHYSNTGLLIVIVSSDKDLKQLIDTNIVCRDPIKNIDINKDAFIQEYGFEPKNMLDYLILVGDSSDNIPGIPGIGTKTATQLIQKYQNIENMYTHLDSLPEELAKKLDNARDMITHTKRLVQLYNIPTIAELPLDTFVFYYDYTMYTKILVHDHNFKSVEKILYELHNKWTCPQQESLF